jgi:hypothetical protein
MPEASSSARSMPQEPSYFGDPHAVQLGLQHGAHHLV